MTRHTAKRPAVRVRWELEEYTLKAPLGRGGCLRAAQTGGEIPPQRAKPPLCNGRWHGEAVTEGLSTTDGLNPLSQARKERAPGIPRDVMRGKALRASSP